MITAGQRFTFVSPYSIGPTGWTTEAFEARQGTEAEVLGILDPASYDGAQTPHYARIDR